MRAIDADALLEIYKKWIPQLLSKEDEGDRRGAETCIAVLEDAPVIDVVPAPNYRVPSTDEWMERYGTKKQIAGYEKRKENSSNGEM